MLDMNFVRANLDLVRKKLEARGFVTEAIDRFNELDDRRRKLVSHRDDLNATRNSESQAIGKLMKAGQEDQAESRRQAVRELGESITATAEELGAVEEDLKKLMTSLPNLPHDSVPVGSD
jgi:seryl-tRNA synthetase